MPRRRMDPLTELVGLAVSRRRRAEDSEAVAVAALRAAGSSWRDVADRLGLDRSTVHRHYAEAEAVAAGVLERGRLLDPSYRRRGPTRSLESSERHAEGTRDDHGV